MIKRNDLILIGGVIFLALAVILFMNLTKENGSYVTIFIDGVEYKTLSLEEDGTYIVEGDHGEKNTLVIKDGYVDMIDANCPDKLCVKERSIHFNNETITCLPNRVVLQIVSDIEDEVDAVAK